MAMRFARLPEGGENPFSDVTSSDWFYDQVVGAVQYGWITGYTDGTFRPEATITRAEVTAITNRLLDRAADEDYVDDHAGELRQFFRTAGRRECGRCGGDGGCGRMQRQRVGGGDGVSRPAERKQEQQTKNRPSHSCIRRG